ncbi:hypothetical protein D3C76_1091200 [compost metagenome]
MPFIEGQERVAKGFVAAEDIHATFWNFRYYIASIQVPECFGGNTRQKGVVPTFTDAENHIVLPTEQLRVHLQHQLRWFLQVGSHDRKTITTTGLKAYPNGRERAKVAGEQDQAGFEALLG